MTNRKDQKQEPDNMSGSQFLDWRSTVDTRLGAHEADISGLKTKVGNLVSKDSFDPVQKIVFAAVALLLMGLLSAVGKILVTGHL